MFFIHSPHINTDIWTHFADTIIVNCFCQKIILCTCLPINHNCVFRQGIHFRSFKHFSHLCILCLNIFKFGLRRKSMQQHISLDILGLFRIVCQLLKRQNCSCNLIVILDWCDHCHPGLFPDRNRSGITFALSA